MIDSESAFRVSHRRIRAAQIGLVVGIVLIVSVSMLPGIWSRPSIDSTYDGFDSNFVYTKSDGVACTSDRNTGNVHSDRLLLCGTGSANLLTTTFNRVAVSMDVTLVGGPEGGPFQIGIWSPWTGSGYFVSFQPATRSLVTTILTDGSPGPTLVGGQARRTTSLGHYVLGSPYHVDIAIDKLSTIVVLVAGSGVEGRDSVSGNDIPGLFAGQWISVTASTSHFAPGATALLSAYRMTLPHQALWADKVDDLREQIALLVLTALSILLVTVAAVRRLRCLPERRVDPVTQSSDGQRQRGPHPRWPSSLLLVALTFLTAAVYIVGNMLLFPLGSQPFDMGVQKLFMYVGNAYGPVELYYIPNLVSVASVWKGTPFQTAAFPYEPVMAYYFSAIGWLYSGLPGGGGQFSTNSVAPEYLAKLVNVAFGLADGVLIYAILRQIGVGQRSSLLGSALFVFNPAVWFTMSVWGQTQVFSLFLVLLAVLLAEKRQPLWAWFALFTACLTRPQMLVFGLLLGVVFIRKFSWQENAPALLWAAILTFLILVPFMLVTSPSLPINVMLTIFRIQEAGGNGAALTTVSDDAYSVWPLVTYLAHGASGIGRMFTPSSASLVGSLSYQHVSQVVTLAVMLVLAAVQFVKGRINGLDGAYLPLVALGITSFLMLTTGLIAVHFVLAVPFLIMCQRWFGRTTSLCLVAIWTVTTLVPMFGDMSLSVTGQTNAVLAPGHSAVARFVVQLYASDRFITTAVVANICVLVWLATLTVRQRPPIPATATAA